MLPEDQELQFCYIISVTGFLFAVLVAIFSCFQISASASFCHIICYMCPYVVFSLTSVICVFGK